MGTFTIRDLREPTCELIHDAKEGKLSIVTKHGQPVFVAVPFDETLLKERVDVALAVKLFDDEATSLSKAAKLARLALSEFIDHLGALKIPVVRYGNEKLHRELADFE